MTEDNQFVDRDDLYIESQIIMTTVRIAAPFVLTYGMFTTFHGANTPGGAFQGGTIVAATMLMLAFAFGIAPTQQWLDNNVLIGLITVGVLSFGVLGVGGFIGKGSFLDHSLFTVFGLKKATKWSMELFEITGIFPIIIGTIIGLFYLAASGYQPDQRDQVYRVGTQ